MVSQLERVLVRTPTTQGKFVEEGFWRQPDTSALLTEHKSFTELLESLGCTVDVAPPVDGLVDAVYVHQNQPSFARILKSLACPSWGNSPIPHLPMAETKFGSMQRPC